MPALNTDTIRKGTSGFSATLTASISNSDATIALSNVNNLATDTAVELTIDRVDSSGVSTPTKREVIIGVVSGLNIVTCLRGQDNTTAQSHSTGAVVECIPTGKWSVDLATNMLTHTDQDGTLKAGAVDGTTVIADAIITRPKLATAFASEFTTGWNTADLPAVSSVTNNGNRSYDITFASTVASILSSGMRLRTTRTAAAPTQCTSLNGTTQYYSKASPNKLTFTDDFVVSAWVKLSSYAVGYIATRYNGTSGWSLNVQSTGQIQLIAQNAGAANYSLVQSYQSIPLNKWVHITAQLDMSAFTATTTTSYVMFDGVDVPAQVQRSGTNPTALIQAGNLEIGAANGGSLPFSGKIAQAAIFNAKVTQATMRTYMSQGLSGSETSLASAYSFNNSITDLNTTTPNDLTANGSAVATNADSPFGNAGTSTTLDYALVMSVSGSTVTCQTAEGCTIPTSGGVTSVAYSVQGNPYGWVSNKRRWTVSSSYLAALDIATTAAVAAWTKGAITVGVGDWLPSYRGGLRQSNTVSAAINASFDLNTSVSGSPSIGTTSDLFGRLYAVPNSATTFDYIANIVVEAKNGVSLSAQTTYNLHMSTASNSAAAGIRGDYGTFVIAFEPLGL
jgi:hypothetical protein